MWIHFCVSLQGNHFQSTVIFSPDHEGVYIFPHVAFTASSSKVMSWLMSLLSEQLLSKTLLVGSPQSRRDEIFFQILFICNWQQMLIVVLHFNSNLVVIGKSSLNHTKAEVSMEITFQTCGFVLF